MTRRSAALSILAAARDAGDADALVVDGRIYSYRELADLARSVIEKLRGEQLRLRVVEGVADLDTVVELLALIELAVPSVLVHPRWSALERDSFLIQAEQLAGENGDEHPLAVLRTSGSSGRPKGVVLSRRAFAAAADAHTLFFERRLPWRGDDRWWLSLSPAHVGGLSILTRCLAARRAVVLRPLERFEAAAVLEVLREDRVTLASLVPTMLHRLLEHGEPPPPTLRAVLLGGAPASPRLLDRAARRGWPVLATYGLTESCAQVATEPPALLADPASRDATSPTPALDLLPGVELELREMAEGGVGRVALRGRQLLSAYLGDAASPLDADGWFVTGDLGRLNVDGRLHILGRADDVILSGGENVHPLLVERALEAHPAVRGACVVGTPSDEWGELVTAVLIAVEQPVADAAVLAWCGERLASFEVPRRIVWVEGFAENAAGKVDRRATRSRILVPPGGRAG